MRGCERKIILLKGTESQMFDEAYFLVRRGFEQHSSDEIVREAERIINRNTTRKRVTADARTLAYLAIGMALGVLMTLLVIAIAK